MNGADGALDDPRLAAALREAAHYKRAYEVLAEAFAQSQTALSQTQTALRQTQAALTAVLGGTQETAEPVAVAESGSDVFIARDDTTILPERAIADLLSEARPGRCVIVGDKQITVKLHELSVNSSLESESKFYVDQTVRAPEMALERLQGQYWFPESGFLVSRHGKVWRHSVLGQYSDPHFLTTYAVQDRKNSDGSIDYIFHESLLRDAPVVTDMHLITSHYASHNYGHYMLDMVPLIATGQQLGLAMLAKPRTAWQKAIYARLGIDGTGVREVSERVVFLKDVIVSNRHNAVCTYCASPHHRQIFERIRAAVPPGKSPADGAKHVFLSRGASKSREMRNRAALIARLMQLGVTTVQPETLSFDDQVRLLSGADLVVSEFGAVMTNVAFCRPGTKVVEIIPEGQNDPWSVRLCAALGLEHIVLFHRVRDEDRESIEIGGRSHNKIFFKYEVDVERVASVVRDLCSRIAGAAG